MSAYFASLCQEVVDRKELETVWPKIGLTLESDQPVKITVRRP